MSKYPFAPVFLDLNVEMHEVYTMTCDPCHNAAKQEKMLSCSCVVDERLSCSACKPRSGKQLILQHMLSDSGLSASPPHPEPGLLINWSMLQTQDYDMGTSGRHPACRPESAAAATATRGSGDRVPDPGSGESGDRSTDCDGLVFRTRSQVQLMAWANRWTKYRRQTSG